MNALPEWFGQSAALEGYVAHASRAPMFVVKDGGKALGFVSLAEHYQDNCEIHSMGVLPAYHRRGIGRLLVERVEQRAVSLQLHYLSVKTLSERHLDQN